MAAGLLLVAAFYWWTPASTHTSLFSTTPFVGVNGRDYYNLATDGLLHGHLHMAVKPDPRLLHLRDPYDPSIPVYRIPDIAYYKGQYYLPFGITPILTLFLPFRALGVGPLPEFLAAAIYAFFAYCFALLLLRLLTRRYAPKTPRWMLLLAMVVLVFATGLPLLLRYARMYEVAVASGACFSLLGLYLIVRALEPGSRSRLLLGLAGLSFGLAVGSRPNLGITAVIAGSVYFAVARGSGPWRSRAAALVLPFGAICIGVLVYNRLRFDSFTEFGNHYQFANPRVSQRPNNNWGNLPAALYGVWVAPLRLSLAFPYFHLIPPPRLPLKVPKFYGEQPLAGLFPFEPIILFAPLAALVAWRAGRQVSRSVVRFAGLVALNAIVLTIAIGYAIGGVNFRYELDFAPLLLVAAILVWFEIGARGSRWVRGIGALLLIWSAIAGLLLSLNDTLRAGEPGTFRMLAQITSPLPTMATMAAGHPVLTDIYNPTGYVTHVSYKTAGVGGASVWLGPQDATLVIVSPGHERVAVEGQAAVGPGVAAGATLALSAGPGSRAAVVSGAPVELPVSLHWGLNEVHVRVQGNRNPPFGPEDSRSQQVVLLQHLILRKLRG